MSSSSSSSSTVSPISSDQSSVEEVKSKRHYAIPRPGLFTKSNLKEREMNLVVLDHSYSKSWNYYSFVTRARPARLLFCSYPSKTNSSNENIRPDDVLDVDNPLPLPPVSYDAMKSRLFMGECERFVNSTLVPPECDRASGDSDWEERITKTGWSFAQSRLFNKATKILHADRLARLTNENAFNEPVMRRLLIDRSAKRFRQLFGSIGWDLTLTQWLNTLFHNHLSVPYLSAYLDILQVLRSKIPALMDKILSLGSSTSKAASAAASVTSGTTNNGGSATVSTSAASGTSVNETLNVLLKRPWDPAPPVYLQKLKKLPGSPLILIAPFGPSPSLVNQMRRMRFYNSQFACLGKVVPVTMHMVAGGRTIPIGQCFEHMVNATRTKIAELRGHFPYRPIVLVGWAIGSLVACQVALVESVSAVVCLGFPFMGVQGGRGDVDDPLLESRTPTMFVIGQFSPSCGVDDLEDMRERMKADTSFVVVGGGDDLLRVSQRLKKTEGVTQSMVDRCVAEEVSEFLTYVFVGVHQETHSSRAVSVVGSQSVYKESRRRKRKPDSGGVGSGGALQQRLPMETSLFAPTTAAKVIQTQLDLLAVPGTSGAQPPPVPFQSSLSLDTDECTGLKIMNTGKRNFKAMCLVATKKNKLNSGTSMVVENSSSDSSNNSLVGGAMECDGSADAVTSNEVATPTISVPKSTSPCGISVNIGALSSLGHARTPKSTTVMTSLVNRTPTKAVQTSTSVSDWSLLSTKSQKPVAKATPPSPGSVPIAIPVRSAFSVPRIGVRPTIGISSFMTYALGTHGLSASTATSQATSLLLTNKGGASSSAGSLETVRSTGRIVLCKTEPNKEQVQTIQKLQLQEIPLTTVSVSSSVGSPIITQAKLLSSRGLDLKRLQTLSTSSLVSQGVSSQTSQPASLLISTAGKQLLVSGSALSVARLCGGVETTEAGSTAERARRTNPNVNFAMSSVKLHLPDQPQSCGTTKSPRALSPFVPKVSLIMLSSAAGTRVSDDVCNTAGPSKDVAVKSFTEEEEGKAVLQLNKPQSVTPDVSAVVEVAGDETVTAVADETISATNVCETDSIVEDSKMTVDEEAAPAEVKLDASVPTDAEMIPDAPAAHRISARNRPPPFPTIAATRTRRIRAPKYMYYDL